LIDKEIKEKIEDIEQEIKKLSILRWIMPLKDHCLWLLTTLKKTLEEKELHGSLDTMLVETLKIQVKELKKTIKKCKEIPAHCPVCDEKNVVLSE